MDYNESIRTAGPFRSKQIAASVQIDLDGSPITSGVCDDAELMQDHGGPYLSDITVYLLWAGTPSFDKDQFIKFAQELTSGGENGYFKYISPYTGGTFKCNWGGSVDGPAISGTFSDLAAQNYLNTAIGNHLVPPADGHNVYCIMCPPSATPVMGGLSGCTDFCAYHSFTGNMFYTVEVDPSCVGCQRHPGEPIFSQFGVATMALAHELAESVTNPTAHGWFEDSTGSENGDLCNRLPMPWGLWTVQGYFVNTVPAPLVPQEADQTV